MDIFKCDENSKFLQYELTEKDEFIKEYSKEKLSILAQDLIWGDV